jgi:GNAT superfamily N-acetyltransferase
MDETYCIAPADHPSICGEVREFVCRLQTEQRFFGPTARRNPKPSRSLVDALCRRGGFRLAAVEHGKIIGLARVDDDGELFIAVDAEHRRHGIGTALGRMAAIRAVDIGHRRLVMRTTRRSHAAQRVGEELGCVVIHGHRGRTELILDLMTVERIA